MALVRESATATRLNDGRVLVVGGVDASGNMVAQAEVYDASGAVATTVGSLAEARSGHVAMLLNDGRVLIAGGYRWIYGGSTWPIALRLSSAEIFDPASGQFTPAAPMSAARMNAGAAMLADGRVLVTGGYGSFYTATAEIFNPATNSFSSTGSMATARNAHTATRLASGKVLVAGGDTPAGPTAGAEIYDPATGLFTAAANMTTPRRNHTATLKNDRVILIGGNNDSGVLASTESYDVEYNQFNASVSLSAPRMNHTTTLLPGGKIVIAGGWNSGGDLASVEITPNSGYGFVPFAVNMPQARSGHAAAVLSNGGILFVGGRSGSSRLNTSVLYDPKFGAVGPLNSVRYNHTATKLQNGAVLIAGGQTLTPGNLPTRSVDLYLPASRTFAAAGPMIWQRFNHTATLLANGRVLVAGGRNSTHIGDLATAEVYDPQTNTFTPVESMSATRSNHTATLLPNGRVLITGGILTGATRLATAELYDPATNTFSPTGQMRRDRAGHTATLLANGLVLIAGGYSDTSGGITYSAELYDPINGVFTLLPQEHWMVVNRQFHTATLLPNGQVLIAGGSTNAYAPTRAAEVFDPASGAFWLVGQMAMARESHAAVQTGLPGGKVLVMGGNNRFNRDSLDLVEAYDPSTGAFESVGQMQFDRVRFGATLLDDTSILLTGGTSGYGQWGASAELSKYTHCGPLVTSMTPSSGQAGTVVTIGGAQFGHEQGSSEVTFNGVPAPIAAWSDTSISTSVPSGASTGPMVITVNGRQSNSPTFFVTAPDLSIVSISANPASPAPNAPVTITVTARNNGDGPVDAFRVDFFKHSPAPPSGSGDVACDLSGLAAGATGTCVGTVTYTEGTQSMWAIVDGPGAIAESNEDNNVFGPQVLVVSTPMPDLVVSVMADPPATGLLGGRISLSDTTRNSGNGSAVASATRYYLSLDTVKSSNDSIMVVRSVSALAPGGTHTYNLQVTLSTTLALANYYVIACADDANQVSERDETNNCRVSTTQIQIVSPDLIATGVSNPPANAWAGGSFTVADAVLNQGNGSAGASTTRYWLSADGVKGGADRMLNGTRAVPALAVNQSSGGSAVVSIPGATPLGTYYVLACADDVSQVVEANNNNNCIASATRVTVTGSDLVTTAITNPPASATAGSSFLVGATVMNQGAVPTGATSTTRYFLGLNPYRAGGDWLLTGSRVSPVLAPGATDIFNVTVTLPGTMANGSYYLIVCADEGKTVTEINENNNCRASSTRVDVTRIVIGIPK